LAADAHAPDVIILDLLLAGRSGVELLYELRSYPDWQSIPVLVYSNIRLTDLPAGCTQELGIVDFLYKPTTRVKDIAAAVASLSSARIS